MDSYSICEAKTEVKLEPKTNQNKMKQNVHGIPSELTTVLLQELKGLFGDKLVINVSLVIRSTQPVVFNDILVKEFHLPTEFNRSIYDKCEIGPIKVDVSVGNIDQLINIRNNGAFSMIDNAQAKGAHYLSEFMRVGKWTDIDVDSTTLTDDGFSLVLSEYNVKIRMTSKHVLGISGLKSLKAIPFEMTVVN